MALPELDDFEIGRMAREAGVNCGPKTVESLKKFAELVRGSALERAVAPPWLPIETAPKNMRVLLFDGVDRTDIGIWHPGRGTWVVCGYFFDAKKWAPIPCFEPQDTGFPDEAKPAPQWTEQRCCELEMLRDLLHNVANINHGSHFLQKMQAAIPEANSLIAFNIAKDQTSFLDFLRDLAIADRSGKAACNCRAGECESKAGCRMEKEVATRDPKAM